MERPRGAARSAGSPVPIESSLMELPTSDQTAVEAMPILPSSLTPVSATPCILGHPSAGALSSIMVPIRLDALSYLLNSALLGAYSALPPALLSSSHGRGVPTQQALGCRCQPHYCCAPQPVCANHQQAQVRCCGSGTVGQSSTSCPQEASRGSATWQDFSPWWDRRGSQSPRGWGENWQARGQKDFSRPWRGRRSWGEVDSTPRKAGLWGQGPGRAQDSNYATRKRNEDGRPWDTPMVKRWSGGWPQRRGSGVGETEPTKTAEEDWEADYAGSTARGSIIEEAGSSQPNLSASQGGEDWEKEYEESKEPAVSAPGIASCPEVASKLPSVSLQAKTTPRPPNHDSIFSSYVQNLFSDLPGRSSAVAELHRERQPPGATTKSGTQSPEGREDRQGQVSATLSGNTFSSATKNEHRA